MPSQNFSFATELLLELSEAGEWIWVLLKAVSDPRAPPASLCKSCCELAALR